MHPKPNQCSAQHSLIYLFHIQPSRIEDELFLPFLDHEDHILPWTIERHFLGALTRLYTGRLSFLRPIDCIQGLLLCTLTKIPKLQPFYLSWRTIEPKHLHSTYLESCIQNYVHNLTAVRFSNYMRLYYGTATAIENSWTRD